VTVLPLPTGGFEQNRAVAIFDDIEVVLDDPRLVVAGFEGSRTSTQGVK
jgi:hypothetical protein